MLRHRKERLHADTDTAVGISSLSLAEREVQLHASGTTTVIFSFRYRSVSPV